MPSIVSQLIERGLLRSPPRFLADNVHYETMMGSIAYGVSNDASDIDVYGFCIPPKDVVFPHLAGEIPGFGRQQKRFEQFQQHHVATEDGAKVYDVSIYNIVRFFTLCMENNPNIIDSLFTPARCVLHTTAVGQLVRENRRLFLHRGAWPKFKGYAYSQLAKMASKERTGKRKAMVEKHGFDLKFAYHVVRLLDEAEQILSGEDLDLERNREQLKAIRRGEMTEEEIRTWAAEKEKALEKAYEASPLPWGPDEPAIRALLLRCLEHHYGSLEECVVEPGLAVETLREVRDLIDERGKRLGL